jgi:fructose transport system ATP-binding protein
MSVLRASGLVKRYGQVTALDGMDFELREREILAIIGDNGAGKSTLIKVLSGAAAPDSGQIWLDGQPVRFHGPADARAAGIECCYQDLAMAPAMTIAENLFLGRELRRRGVTGTWLRMLDHRRMREFAAERLADLKVSLRSITQSVETLSGGQRQCVAVARAAAFARHVVILDEPTAALGVKEGRMVLELVRRVRDRGLSVVLISHNMPHVFELADRIHVARLGRCAAVLDPRRVSMNDAVAVMTGALEAAEIASQETVNE